MPVPSTSDEFLQLVRKSGVVDAQRLDATLDRLRSEGTLPTESKQLATLLVRNGVLTKFYAEQFLRGVWRGFTIGKYHILDRIGSGGMGIVYLGEHKLMGNRVAIKVLPVTLAAHPWFLKRFYREAQAVAALNHPNIVRAHDVGQDGKLHFLVMDFVDGSSLQDIVGQHGPMEVNRAAHYVRQAALGLEHLHEIELVHRDIKPGNLLLSRDGTIKILDLGLARFFRDQRELSPAKGSERAMVGTDDYLAPEQIVNSDDVDIRADIYSLGATLYFLLTGNSPFEDVSMAYQKLIRHLAQRPKPVRDVRPEVPAALAAVVEKMMAKNPWERFQTPAAVVAALAPWTKSPIAPPPASEMPNRCLALARSGVGEPVGANGAGSSGGLSGPQIGSGPPSSGLISNRSKWSFTQPSSAHPPSQPASDTVKDPPAAATGSTRSDVDRQP
jgi:eukaryotic-like serine/threonine-protein kinase